MRTKSRRLELDKKLRDILESEFGKDHVHIYFQPPEGQKLIYPCIVYTKDTSDHKYADNKIYHFQQAYQITFMSKDPDNNVVGKIEEAFQYAKYGRNFVADHVNHDIIILYY